MVEVVIQDNGKGIPTKALEKVYDPFFTTKRETGGTGLGLSICKKIVEEHEGSIEIESKKNEGTTVRFCIPSVLLSSRS